VSQARNLSASKPEIKAEYCNFNVRFALLFSLMKKVTKTCLPTGKKIKAENHFREIIFRLALHATQAMSQKCLLWRIWLTRGWLT